MKRLILCLICLALLLSLAACVQQEENSCSFYYLRTVENIRYGQEDGFIGPVNREISDHNPELNYLLQLYLEGPVEEGYLSPIPKGTYLLSTLWDEDTLRICAENNIPLL